MCVFTYQPICCGDYTTNQLHILIPNGLESSQRKPCDIIVDVMALQHYFKILIISVKQLLVCDKKQSSILKM